MDSQEEYCQRNEFKDTWMDGAMKAAKEAQIKELEDWFGMTHDLIMKRADEQREYLKRINNHNG